MPLVNRPSQSYGIVYSDLMTDPEGLANIAEYAVPGGLIVTGRTNFDHDAFHEVSEGGGCVLIYLDAMIDNPYGLYHELLHLDSVYGPPVPRWPPGDWVANAFGYLADFRVGGILHDKLEPVMQQIVADNPHMGGFFMDDVGSRSWFLTIPWDDLGAADPDYQQEYRDGAIAICQTARAVCDEHGLIFVVNGTWNASSSGVGDLEYGGGYPDMAVHGCSLADGGFVEHHPAAQLPYFGPYSASPQWAADSAVTNGIAFNLAVQETDEEVEAYVASNSFAYVVNQEAYAYPPAPYSPLYPTGLPSRVRSTGYTELEWSLKVQVPADVDDVYEFRVLAGNVRLDDYIVTPSLEIGPTLGYWDELLTAESVATVSVIDEYNPGDDPGTPGGIIADALRVGEMIVDKVYAGTTQVWP